MRAPHFFGALLLGASLFASGAIAADDANLAQFDALDRITVTATLNERAQKDVASEVSIIDAEEIDRRQVQDIADLVRYEPGVSVTGDPTRFGLSGFSIRGLDGDRVRIELDGIAVADQFGIGSYADASRDFVDVDALKRVEIVRGAASSLYGSDALGGVVSFTTKDPADYLGPDGGRFVSGKLHYGSANQQAAITGTLAGGTASDGIVLVATHRDGHERDNRGETGGIGSSRTKPNPQDMTSDALLAKYVRNAASGRVDRLSFDAGRGSTDTDVLHALGVQALTGALVTSLRGEDERRRARLAFGQEIPLRAAFADSIDWQVYAQRSDSVQETFEERVTPTDAGPVNPLQRFRRFDFEQRIAGIEAVARKAFDTGSVRHDLTWGLDVSRTRTEELRDGYQRNLESGEQTPVVPPDTFPVRDFPITDTTSAALFAQDELRLAEGRLSLIPGLRVDHYDLDPKPDAIFNEDNPGIATTGLTHTSWSPKLGAIWRFSDSLSAFAQYAHGFRAPPYDDVNIGFTNLAFGYTALPNPDLEPETSDGIEFGLRGGGRLGWFSVSVYENRYRDFIESLSFVGVDPETGLVQFQSINLAKVKIRGAEARYGLDLGSFNDGLAGWTFNGSLAYAHGDNESAGEPLTSIDPARAVIGIAYDSADWGAELVGSFVERKRRLPATEEGQPPLFAAPGFATLDLYAHWQPHPRIELFGALTNLTDRRYWNWGMVRGFTSNPDTIDRYSAPGRAFSVGLRANF